jgi:hypothetical protein
VLDRLLDAVRTGESRALVVSGGRCSAWSTTRSGLTGHRHWRSRSLHAGWRLSQWRSYSRRVNPGGNCAGSRSLLAIGGLAHGDARALLDSAVDERLDERVRDRIVAETRGNPLAMLELPRGLTAAELAGGFEIPDAQPLANRIEQTFLRRFHSLAPSSQQLLLTAAAEPLGDATLLWRAVERFGLEADASPRPRVRGSLRSVLECGSGIRSFARRSTGRRRHRSDRRCMAR